MTVKLIGDKTAFSIDEVTDARQTVAGKPFAQWEWNVTPLKSGNQS
jgi:hypothetical protein